MASHHCDRILEHCRSMRGEPTEAEMKLWGRLRNRQLEGRKFRRQHPVGKYIVDFYYHEAKLAIELDGAGHGEAYQADYDRDRTLDLQSMGIRVVRFWNSDVMDNLEAVLEAVRDALTPTPSRREREL